MRIRYSEEDREPTFHLRPTGDVNVHPTSVDPTIDALTITIENGDLDTFAEDFSLRFRGEDGTLREVCVDRGWLHDGVITLPVATLELPAGRYGLFVARIKGYVFTADGGPSDGSSRELWTERFHGEAWSKPIRVTVEAALTQTLPSADCQRVGPRGTPRADLLE